MSQREELQKNRAYWEKLLGAEVCDSIAVGESAHDRSSAMPLEYEVELKKVKSVLYQVLEITDAEDIKEQQGIFGKFYQIFGRVAVAYADEKDLDILENKSESILCNLYRKIEWIPLRVLIQDIHSCKNAGFLQGNSGEDEYDDYCTRFLGDSKYIRKLCEKYPEMTELLLKQILNHVLYLKEIVDAACDDREVLSCRFFKNKSYRHIKQIDCGQSDAHRQGRTVAIVHFDNGEKLVYKPRGLGKEIYFEALYEEFCAAVDLNYERISVLDRGTYGWQSYVSGQNCEDKVGIARYFTRMGIVLFLCYCLGATDMHGENIIADGEYPRLIDLETIPGVRKPGRVRNAEELVRDNLKSSVLSIGILPVTMWNSEGQGVIINALHGKQKATTPFKVPIVNAAKSSDIFIGYREGTVDLSGSLPGFGDQEVNPADYGKEICVGFQTAYRYLLEHKEEIGRRFETLFTYESRYLIRHTQQYGMLLRTSFYPDFLETEDRRRLFLHSLDARGTDDMKTFLEYEREALYQMDIPVFYAKGKETSLFDGNGKEYPDYFTESALEQWQERLEKLDEKDLKRQVRLIELSLSSLLEYQREGEKTKKSVTRLSGEVLEAFKAELIKRIADKICDLAVVYEGLDIGFSGLNVLDENNQSITPMGMYLYDGIAGVTVFMAEAMRYHYSERYVRICGLLVAKMFRYTEHLEEKGKPESEHIGAFVGEGSLVIAYLLLHEITGDDMFIAYAKRHAAIVMTMWQKETSMDLLSGCAGAMVALLKLHKITGEVIYCDFARQLEGKLWQNLQRQENGIGWCMANGKKALAGMAHGNSGILLAYAYLMEAAPEKCYIERIHELQQYEDSLYDEELGNWKDLRHTDGERTSSNAWCHGASGILLTRVKLKQLQEFEQDEQIEKDIVRCREILLKGRDAREVCLCHGMAGDYLALACFLEQREDCEIEAECEDVLMHLVERMNKNKDVLVKERESISLMAGMPGVGLALCSDKVLSILLLQ